MVPELVVPETSLGRLLLALLLLLMEQLAADTRPGIWQVICQDNASLLDTVDGDVPPIYEPPPSPTPSTCGDTRSLDNEPPSELPSTFYHSDSFLQMEAPETFTYTYNVSVGNTHCQFTILVESDQDFDKPNHYIFSLFVKIGRVERAIAQPITMKLFVNPGGLDFVVFAYAPRSSLPANCLYNLRVWLRSGGIDHRIFGEKDIWFGRDPDFRTITDASFAHLRKTAKDLSIYQGIVGRACVNFILRWTLIEPHIYTLSFEYEAGGVGKTFFENLHLKLDCEPHTLSFLIYSIPVPSTPAGASHRLRLWLQTPLDPPPPPTTTTTTTTSDALPSYLCQRLWKSDDFKIGARLRFDAVDHTLLLATRATTDDDATTPPGVTRGTSSLGLGPLGLGLNFNSNLDRNGSVRNGVPLAPRWRRMSRPRVVDEPGAAEVIDR